MGAYEELEDKVLGSVLHVQLEGPSPPSDANTPNIKLSTLVEELAAEGIAHPVLLGRSNLERVLVDRLMTNYPADYPQAPFPYLLGCFDRSCATPAAPAEHQAALSDTLMELRGLLVSYAGFTLIMGLVQQPEAAEKAGALQLLHALECDSGMLTGGPEVPSGTVRMPPGFLEAFAERYADEGFDSVLAPVMTELGRRVAGMSLMGDFMSPFQILTRLCTSKPVARCLVKTAQWLPKLQTGRSAQLETMLGPFFAIGALPDDALMFVRPQPDIRTTCFANYDTLRQSDIVSSFQTIRQTMTSAGRTLFTCVKSLLGKDTRPAMLSWIAGALAANGERGKMQVNYNLVSSHNFFINLQLVLLELCQPFIDPASGKAFQHIDARFIGNNARVDWSDLTKVIASEPEDAEYRKRLKEAEPSPSYHFICECFFLTSHCFHLGMVKMISDMHDLQRELQQLKEHAENLEAQNIQDPRIQRALNELHSRFACFSAVLMDETLISNALAYYRLMAAWLLRLASPDYAATRTLALPLPEPVPEVFATLPEALFEDMTEVLLLAARQAPQIMQRTNLTEIMAAVTVFVGSPKYVRSPHIRYKLVEIIYCCLPEQQRHTTFGRSAGIGSSSDMLELLLQTDPVVLKHMVPSLFQLYVDVENTDRSNQFYIKFNYRCTLSDIFEYLWALPAHKQVWVEESNKEGGRGLYLQFTNMIVNDAIYLLDESLKKLEKLRTLERTLADEAAVAAMTDDERRDTRNDVASTGRELSSLMYMGLRVIALIAMTSGEANATFLLPEMVERIAGMLNFFLKYITGPERKKLNIKDKDKYNFRPRELLSNIMTIYLNLYKADTEGAFSRAIACDGRSYRPEMFPEAMHILSSQGLFSMEQLDSVQALAAQVTDAGDQAMADDDALGDAPDEFLDPITYTLMHDPVIMPSSGMAIDRAVITRHLLTDPRDPINRAPLKAEDLKPATELKEKIDAWVASQRAAAKAAKAAAAAGGDAMQEG